MYLDSHSTPRVSTPSKISSSTTKRSTKSDEPSRSSTKINILASGKKQSKEKEMFTFIIVGIASAAIMLLLGFILVLRCRKRDPKPPLGMFCVCSYTFYTRNIVIQNRHI